MTQFVIAKRDNKILAVLPEENVAMRTPEFWCAFFGNHFDPFHLYLFDNEEGKGEGLLVAMYKHRPGRKIDFSKVPQDLLQKYIFKGRLEND